MQTTENPTGESSIDNRQPEAAFPLARRASRRRWWAVALGAVAVAGLTLSVARAQGFGGHFGGPGSFMMKERMDHALSAAGATDAQKTQIHAIWEGLRPQLKPLRHQAADLRHQMGEAIAAPTIDKGRVETLRKQSIDTMDRISALVTQGMMSSAQVLSPEQRQAVLKQIEEQRHHGRHADGAPGGEGIGE